VSGEQLELARERPERDRRTDVLDELLTRRALVGGPGVEAAAVVSGVVLVSERESGPWISCAPCSGVMAARWAKPSIAATLDSGHRVRSAAGLPHSGGMSASQLRAGVSGALGVSLEWVDKAAVDDRLRAGYAVAAFLTYGTLPSHFRRWCPDFTGGHAVMLAGVRSSDGAFGLFDPLATTGYGGEWILWADLSPALWADHLGARGDVMGPKWTPNPARMGRATVTADGVSLIRTADGGYTPVHRGQVLDVFGGATIRNGTYAGRSAWVVQVDADDAGLLLASAAVFDPEFRFTANPERIGVATVSVPDARLLRAEDGWAVPAPVGSTFDVFGGETIRTGPYEGHTAWLVNIDAEQTGLLIASQATFDPDELPEPAPEPPTGGEYDEGVQAGRTAMWDEWDAAIADRPSRPE
jgi:hypothetical protein